MPAIGKSRTSPLIILLILTLFLQNPLPARAQSTDPNFKVAFIGDTGAGNGFQSVLNLIKNEGAQLVLHQGDYGYSATSSTWGAAVNSVLGANFPYLGSDGNHENWGDYAPFMKDRLTKMGLDPNVVPTTKSSYSVAYKGLKMVFSAENGDPAFVQSSLAGDTHTWKVCSWHKNMTAMQVGGKGNEQGWGDYENCRQAGAIIATGHEHTYHRTKTLTSTQSQTVDTAQHPLTGGVPGNPNQVKVAPGKTFVFVSGLGGNGKTRTQQRCLPNTYPYNGTDPTCNYIWASIFTGSQTPQTQPPGPAEYGALFITFNYQGNPNKAHAYFKTVTNQIVDEFDITAGSGGGPVPTNTPTQITNTPAPGGKPGDANSDNIVDGQDYMVLRANYNTQASGGASIGDFDGNARVDGQDYMIWRGNYLK